MCMLAFAILDQTWTLNAYSWNPYIDHKLLNTEPSEALLLNPKHRLP